MSSQKKPFTLSKLIAIVAVVAIIAVVFVPLITSFIEKSRIASLISTASILETAANAYHQDVGSFPDGNEEEHSFQTTELVANPNKKGWDGPYLHSSVEGLSPWGSKMLLTTWDMFLGTASKEYILIVEDGVKGADIPTASINNLDVKIDGSVDKMEGKCQFDINSRIFITIITDAYDINSSSDNIPSNTE